MKKEPAPVILFTYNRPWHTEQTVNALKNNELANDSELYIYSDGPKTEKDIEKVEEIRNYIKTVVGFKSVTVIEREKNFGLANNIINGVTEVVNKYERVIVLEDDLITLPYFLKYMNDGLDFYENEEKIISIGGYNFPRSTVKIPENYPYQVYFNPRPCSTSWATWKNRWEKVDWDIKDFEAFKKDHKAQQAFNYAGDNATLMLFEQRKGKIDSWAVRWHYNHFKSNGFCVYPIKSLIYNIGFDGSGIHSGLDKNKVYTHTNFKEEVDYIEFTRDIKVNEEIIKSYRKALSLTLKLKIWIFLKKFIPYDYFKITLKRHLNK